MVDHLVLVFRDSPWGPWIRWTATLAVVVFMASCIGAQIIAVGEAMERMVQLFPDWFAGLLLAGIIGAILSTSDSMVLVTAADLTRLCKTQLADRVLPARMIHLGRRIASVMAVFGIALAYWRPGTTFDIIEFAFVGLGATLGLPPAFLALWPRTAGADVFATVVAGLASAVGSLHLWRATFPILVWPLTLAVFLGTICTTARSPATVSAS